MNSFLQSLIIQYKQIVTTPKGPYKVEQLHQRHYLIFTSLHFIFSGFQVCLQAMISHLVVPASFNCSAFLQCKLLRLLSSYNF